MALHTVCNLQDGVMSLNLTMSAFRPLVSEVSGDPLSALERDFIRGVLAVQELCVQIRM